MKWLVLGIFLVIFCLAEGRDSEDARVIATRSTKTAIILTTSTTTTPFTCALLTNAATCQRRRYRRYTAINENHLQEDEALLDGSLADDEEHSRSERDAPAEERDPRIALTIWTTSSSTFTVTSTSINTAITFSLSFYCTVNGVAFPPACG
ncbi:uncharacterized protein [Panulirus ornatus]|uniref:uncharacterized protein n=1 Tax=Panulirus ornatus TaxID=150431 RepID=UPI003A8C55EB